jgi:hypothetical protein
MKKCIKCKQEKNKKLFSSDKHTWDKLKQICKPCELDEFLNKKQIKGFS